MGEDPLSSEDPVERAAAAAALGVSGGAGPEVVARLAGLVRDDPDPRVRAAALGALARLGGSRAEKEAAWHHAATDPEPAVRRRAAEVAPEMGADVAPSLVALLADSDPLVAEAAAFSLGELAGSLGELAASLGELAVAGAVPALAGAVTSHHDPLVREAAVAALGSLGDPAGLSSVLAALDDRPSVRRRAVLALAAFEGPEVEAALRRALDDRDWQVRQAAEDLLRP